MGTERKYDLEDRLVLFAVLIINISENLVDTKAGDYLSAQMLRSGTSPALHYGEAQGAESPRDFIHKIKVVLKELRETMNALKIVRHKQLCTKKSDIDNAMDECNQLISIFVTSIATAKRNAKN